jgi:hypothetical protein
LCLRGGEGKAGTLQSDHGSVLIYDGFASPGLDSRVSLSDCSRPFAAACRPIQWEPWPVPDEFFHEAILVAQRLQTTEPRVRNPSVAEMLQMRGGWTQ